jgi:photosystem II stability/assembly factor-like uncharacterized protein
MLMLTTVTRAQWEELYLKSALPVVSIASNNSDTLFISTGKDNQQGFFYSSTDGGKNWNEIIIYHKSGTLTDSTYYYNMPISLSINKKGGILFCTGNCAYFTTKFGKKWKYYYTNIGKGAISEDNSLFIANNDRINGYSQCSVQRSVDNGSTWTTLSMPATSSINSFVDIKAFNNSIFIVKISSTKGIYPQYYTVYKSTNNGDTWSDVFNITNNFNTLHPEHLVSLDASPDGTLLLSSDLAVYRSTNNGGNWVKTDSLTEHAGFTTFCFVKAEIVFAWNQNGIYKSTDNGNSWKRIDAYFATSTLAADLDGNLYAGTTEGKINKRAEYAIATPVTELPDNTKVVPDNYYLAQNYPNPFNPATTIKYAIKQTGFVTIKVFDMLGREIVTLINEVKSPGNYETEFNAVNLPSGIYLYKIQAGYFVQTKKMILIK